MFNHILCATDTSADADRALDYAGRIATENGAELHLVHVVEKLATGKVAGRDAHLDEQERYDKLNCQAGEFSSRGLKVTLHTPYAKVGAVASCVATVANDNDVDLIVVGTRGRSALAGAVLGSVTQGLLHASSCPVLAVPHRSAISAGPTSDALATAS